MCLNRVFLSSKYPSKSGIRVRVSGNTRLNRVFGYGCQLWVSYPYPSTIPEFFQVHIYGRHLGRPVTPSLKNYY